LAKRARNGGDLLGLRLPEACTSWYLGLETLNDEGDAVDKEDEEEGAEEEGLKHLEKVGADAVEIWGEGNKKKALIRRPLLPMLLLLLRLLLLTKTTTRRASRRRWQPRVDAGALMLNITLAALCLKKKVQRLQ
jgi:hypothetical protein